MHLVNQWSWLRHSSTYRSRNVFPKNLFAFIFCVQALDGIRTGWTKDNYCLRDECTRHPKCPFWSSHRIYVVFTKAAQSFFNCSSRCPPYPPSRSLICFSTGATNAFPIAFYITIDWTGLDEISNRVKCGGLHDDFFPHAPCCRSFFIIERAFAK